MTTPASNGAVVCTYIDEQFKPPMARHIHQMWKTKELPDRWIPFKQQCLNLNPGYKYTLWDDNDIEAFLKTHYSWFMDTYYAYPENVMRADSARYFILLHYGGVYIDGDMDCQIPFDHMLNTSIGYGAIVAETSPIGMTNNFMAAKQGHPFMKMITEGLTKSYSTFFATYLTVLFSTGPIFVYRTYLGYPCQQHVRVLTVAEHAAYMRHDHASTWHGSEGPFIRWLDRNHLAILAILIITPPITCTFMFFRYIYHNFPSYSVIKKHFDHGQNCM